MYSLAPVPTDKIAIGWTNTLLEISFFDIGCISWGAVGQNLPKTLLLGIVEWTPFPLFTR